MKVALLTIRKAWGKNGAAVRYSVNACSVPNRLLWQILSLSAVTKGIGIFLFSCVGGRDQGMWCSVSLIKMTWLFCSAMVSQRGGWQLKHLILFHLVLPLRSWTQPKLDEAADLTAGHACVCICVQNVLNDHIPCLLKPIGVSHKKGCIPSPRLHNH